MCLYLHCFLHHFSFLSAYGHFFVLFQFMPKLGKSVKGKSKRTEKKGKPNSTSPTKPSSPTLPSLPLPIHSLEIAREHNLKRVHRQQQQKVATCCCCFCYFPKTMGIRGKRRQWNSDDELNEAEQQMQKKTFTNWINFFLEEHSSSGRVTDLFVDMCDGLLLCHLLEVLTGEVLLARTESAVVTNNGQMNGKPCKKRLSSDNSKYRNHNLANLSVALTCLRDNGVQVLSNSVADLADGNLHAWLALVWQIILHFQIHKNLTLLRQCAWHQRHQQKTQQSGGNYHCLGLPSTSNGGGAIVASTMGDAQKEGVEQQLLRWVTGEVIDDLGLRVRDFDRSWCDGRLFCSLVHRFAPALMSRGDVLGGGNDVESALRRTENALEMARIHLGIRSLLDPRDVSASEFVPDKRSIITYISQFVRLHQQKMYLPKRIICGVSCSDAHVVAVEVHQQTKRISAERMEFDDVFGEWLHWLHSVVTDHRLRLTPRQRVSIHHFIWFTQIRDEFWERRTVIVDHLLGTVRRSASDEEGDGLAKKVAGEIEQLECSIADWECHLNAYFPDSHSDQLVPLSRWISSGERLLSSNECCVPDQLLDAGQLDETLHRLEAAIGRLEQFFSVLSTQRALLYDLEHKIGSVSPSKSFSTDFSLLQPVHLLADLRQRFDTLSEKQRNTMTQLLFEQCRFRVLGRLGILKSKIRIWKTQLNDAEQTLKTLAEWMEFGTEENPKESCEHLINSLRNSIPKPSPTKSSPHYDLESRLRAVQLHSQLAKELRQEIDRFLTFGKTLEQLVEFWKEFEIAEKHLLSETLLKDEWIEKLKDCEGLITKIDVEVATNEAKKRISEVKKRNSWKKIDDQATRMDQCLVALCERAEDTLNESATTPQSYEQLCTELDMQTELSEQFGNENSTTIGEPQTSTLTNRIAHAKEVREQLEQRRHNWDEFVQQRDRGTAQLDQARNLIAMAERTTCRSVAEAEADYEHLQEAQSSLTSLNTTIDQLQQLADKLDPLAAPYAEVRFLDVEFGQLEKHFGDVRDQMHNELEQEKVLAAEIEQAGRETDDLVAQLLMMGNNLEALQHVQQTAIPALEAKITLLEQQSEREKPLRKYVLRPTAAPSLAELTQRVVQSKCRAQEAAQRLERVAQDARNEQLRDQATRMDQCLVALCERAEDTLNESATTPQSYEQLCTELDMQTELSEQFGNENSTTIGEPQTSTLTNRIAHAKEVREQLEQRRHNWDEFVQQRDRGTAQLDQARNLIAMAERTTCRSVAEAETQYDLDAVAEILSAIYPGREPLDVMREHGLEKFDWDDDYEDVHSATEQVDVLLTEALPQPSRPSESSSTKEASTSPVPEDPSHIEAEQQQMAQFPLQQQQQHSRWRRVLRTALPLQAMLVLLLGAACLVPHCDDEYCCHLLNNFARSFDPQLDFINGPPPF